MKNLEYYKLKEEFLNEWPLSRIHNLKLEEYTNLDKTSFCYWVEAKTNLLGSIWGGSAYKFGIYKRRDKSKEVLNGNRMTDDEYAWHSKYGKTREEAFSTIKLILLEIVESAQNNDLESIDKLNLGNAYKWKIAFLYNDFKIVNIYKWDNLYNAAELLGFNNGTTSYSALNNFILQKKDPNQDYFDFTHFLWNKSEIENNETINNEKNQSFDLNYPNQIFFGPPGTGKTHKINSFLNSTKKTEVKTPITSIKVDRHKTFWHLAPGQGGYLWNDLKNGTRLGYEWCSVSLGNLNHLDKKQTENFKMRTYFSDVKQGDYLCIISGKKFYGIAEALHNYDFSKAIVNGFDFQTIEVKWIKIFDTPELLSASYTPTFGKLNGGKRWNSLIQALQENNIVFDDTATIESVKLIPQSTNSIFTTFHQSFSYEDFIEGIKPDLDENDELRYTIEDGIFKIACDKAANLAGFEDLNDALKSPKEIVKAKFEVSEPFYLFIDEINRGNISQIFGELITLIEKDKRLGQVNETRVTLPYSKNEIQFSVPPNLYIIGTMNTADRSVEALDTALRRRFSFTEMLPDRSIIEDKGFNDYLRADIMDKINNRIELLLDRNYTLGHSYFMKENFENSFKNEIIPLLQEYFYNDYSKIGLILGRGFVREKARPKHKEVFADFYGIDDVDIQKTFELIPFDELNFDEAIQLL